MNKYKVTVSATHYYYVECYGNNTDEAEMAAIKMCQQQELSPFGAIEHEIVSLEEIEHL